MKKDSTYRVGTATADLTPGLNLPVYLAGFAPGRRATSVLHPLQALVLYLADQAGSELCLVSLDLIGFLHQDVQRIRARAGSVMPPERILVCSTHTHSGPDTLGLWGKALLGTIPYRSGVDERYMDRVVDCVADAVIQARRAAAPARLSAVTFDTPPRWIRNERTGGGYYRRAVALYAVHEDGARTVMLNFAAHPEALWDKNQAVSPDYPACFRRSLNALGAGALFFSGPLGAMLTPDVPRSASLDHRKTYIERLGFRLARLTLEAAGRGEELSGPLRFASMEFCLPNHNRRFEWGRRLGLLKREIPDGNIHTEMAAACIGGFRLLTVPGEASPELGQALYRVQRQGHRMLLCLGLDELGYLLPSEFFDNPEYKYEQSMSVGPHAAPVLVEHAKQLVDRIEKR